jgi:hypothetical protein
MRPSNTARMQREWPDTRQPSARRGAKLSLATALVCAAGLAAAASAGAASAPFVTTGRAKSVSYASATLTGTINPHGADASYFFQYGPTKKYGAQTEVADAGHGTRTVTVRFPVVGLQPATKYHFRLIAINASGAGTGADGSFTTAKVPLSLQILVAPNPVLFGGTAFVQGALSGTGNGGAAVALQANPFPYTQGFANIGNPELTMANGAFSFPVLGVSQATQFRVVTVSAHPVVSPVVTETVAVGITVHVTRTRRHRARFFGIVTPAEDGAEVAILRIAHGRGILVGGAHLRHRDPQSSAYTRTVRVQRGAYRVLVVVNNGAQISNYSRTLLIG